jgi:hypothetical protein
MSTVTALSVTPATSITMGTPLTLQAAVASADNAVTQGSVTFFDGTRTLAVVQVVYSGSSFPVGTANLKVFLGPGTHGVKAVYAYTNAFLGSVSTVTTITVSAASSVPTTTITSSGSAGNYTLTGKVTATSAIVPSGQVSFLDQSNADLAVDSASLDPATATRAWQSFAAFATANPVYAVLIGDLNGDGIPDLVTSNYSGTTISVLLGNGDGTFQSHVDYAVGSFPFGMAMGDLNGDGIPDLAVAAHNSSAVEVLLGNGDGTFQPAQSLTTAGTSQYVAMADFNGDGILDLVTCSSGGSSISVFLGNGDGTFQTEQSFGTGSITFGLAVADFNNDGLPDVAVSNNDSNAVSIFLGNGDGTFQAQADSTVATSPTTMAAADLNADGNVDLVVGSQSGTAVSLMLGNGDGTFQTTANYSGFATPWGVSLVDLNNDGILDIAVASPTARAVEVFPGKGDGTFLSPVTTATGVTNYVAAFGDLNGDGAVDLVVPSITSSYVLQALGSISVTATATTLSVPGGGSHSIAASYAGDATYASSTSLPISLTGTLFPTTLQLAATPASAAPGQAVVLTADLSPFNSSGYTAAGTVSFSDGATALGSPVSLINGTASLSKSDFSIGTHTISANYSGDANFLPGASSSQTVTTTSPQTINFAALNPVTYGAAPLALTATASSGLSVTFSLISGPATISGTTLTITGAGNVTLQADQPGDSTYQPAPPMQRTLTVSKAPTNLTLSTSSPSINANANVTFTATITSTNLPSPAGSATFLDGTTQLATTAFNASGVAAYSTTSLAPGTHSITATYAGSANFLASSSTALTEAVITPDYSITATPATLTIPRGATGTSILTITPTGGFTGQIAFTCAGLPPSASCTFLPSTVMLPGDDSAHTVQLSLSTSSATAASKIPGSAFWLLFGILACSSLSSASRAHRFSTNRVGTAALGRPPIALLAILLSLTACAGNKAPQPPATSTVTLTAAALGGSIHHAATLTITITP